MLSLLPPCHCFVVLSSFAGPTILGLVGVFVQNFCPSDTEKTREDANYTDCRRRFFSSSRSIYKLLCVALAVNLFRVLSLVIGLGFMNVCGSAIFPSQFCGFFSDLPVDLQRFRPSLARDEPARKRKSIPKGNKRKQSSVPKTPNNIASENSDSSAKRSKSEDDEKDAANAKQSKALEAPKDYIHVRARRGQATDAHSLAERKISERMKMLQDLVLGCNKVTGKAVMLDEIINYVQSLQRQVEFLSMKLSTVNPSMDEALMSNSKDMFESRGSMPHNMYPPESYHFPSQPNTNTANNFSAAFGRNQSLRIDNFSETASQVSTFWEDDLHSVVQMRYNQNDTQDFHGTGNTAMGGDVAGQQLRLKDGSAATRFCESPISSRTAAPRELHTAWRGLAAEMVVRCLTGAIGY
ncbi:hypothetical protein CASFOL_002355 [Castilleja foliolosa]|uniref:BHLH domain-containing protein n=1 Tax=Castilleja foliolosa TaxID=1961234 RepID=A0ABD3EHK7_9LAMI